MSEQGEGDGDDEQLRLEESEYNDDREGEEAQNTEGIDWRAVVTDICKIRKANDEVSNGVRSKSDLDSLVSNDNDGEQMTKKSTRELNPRSSLDGFKFKLGM